MTNISFSDKTLLVSVQKFIVTKLSNFIWRSLLVSWSSIPEWPGWGKFYKAEYLYNQHLVKCYAIVIATYNIIFMTQKDKMK